MAKRGRIFDFKDGGILAVKDGQYFYLTCCDCCLTHRIDVCQPDDEIHLKITRDDRRTSQKRRRYREGLRKIKETQ